MRRDDGGLLVTGRLRGRLREATADDGFTLVELVVCVAIVGFVAVALAGVVLSYLRVSVAATASMAESHDVQLASAYWQRDVASIGVRSSTYDTSSHSFPLTQSVGLAPCGLPTGATAVVTLGWSEYDSLDSTATPALVKVTWATRADGGVLDLLRVRCGSRPSTVQVADSLSVAPAVTCRGPAGAAIACGGSGADVPAQVDLALTALDNSDRAPQTYQATLSGERRQT